MNKYATIDGFESLTEQQVFDISAKHLLTQMSKSIRLGSHNSCVYRSPDGKMCAAGPFLKDEIAYACEGKSWSMLIGTGKVPAKHQMLVCSLQSVHDFNLPTGWKEELEEVADIFGLEFKEDEYVPQGSL